MLFIWAKAVGLICPIAPKLVAPELTKLSMAWVAVWLLRLSEVTAWGVGANRFVSHAMACGCGCG